MSESEQDAQLGKAMRDLANVRDEIRRRTVQASQLADKLDELAKMLKENPRDIFFSTDSIPTAEYSRHKAIFEIGDIDGEAVQQVAGMIRKLEAREKELEVIS